jgi:hypothetical protein
MPHIDLTDAQAMGETVKILLEARGPISDESVGFVYAARCEIEILSALVDHVLSGRLAAVRKAGLDPKKTMHADDFALRARRRAR